MNNRKVIIWEETYEMNKSLEALKRLDQETCPATYMPDFDKKECIEIIRKDLEVLEILKSKLTICPSADNKSTYLIAKFNEEYNRTSVYPFVKSGEYEALEKIKEWLEDE